MKRCISLLLCAALLAATLATAALAAPAEPPTLKELFLQEQRVAPGGLLTAAADVTDEGGGIEQVVLRFSSDLGGESLFVTLRRNTDHSIPHQFSGRLTLPQNAKGGYTLESAVVTDDTGTPRRYFRDSTLAERNEPLPNALHFMVQVDGAIPAAADLSFDLASVPPGGTLTATFTPQGSAAGFRSASFIFQNAATGRRIYLSFGAADRQEDGSYQKELEISAQEPAGRFTLYKMTVRDQTGADQLYSNLGGEDHLPLPFGAAFSVGDGPEALALSAAAPALQWVRLTDQRPASNGEEMEFYLQAQLTGSQIDHVTLRFKSAGGKTLTKVLRPQEGQQQSLLEDWFTVKTTEPAGVYQLDSAVVADQLGNRRAYSADGEETPLPSQPAFTLQGATTGEDTTPPVLQSLTIDRTQASRYGTVEVTAVATDGQSGVKTVTVQFTSHAGKVITCKLREYDGHFTGWLNLERADPGSVWHLTRVIVTDQAGNRQGYYESPRGKGLALPAQLGFSIEEE